MITRRWMLAGAVAVGLLARLPGVFWGYNFPPGFGAHHPDEWTHFVLAEHLIDPSGGARWQQYYPKGMAAMTALPIIAWRAATGRLSAPPPPMRELLTVGRFVSVLFGVATILVVFLLGQRVFKDQRVGLAAAWGLALGGLHVTESHFFLADTPALFFLLTGLLLLIVDIEKPPQSGHNAFNWAAFAFGAAFGFKLFVAGLPSLGVVALLKPHRIRRIAYAGVFFLAGFTGVNLAMFTPLDLVGVLASGMNDPYVYSRAWAVVVYLLDAPAIFGLPMLFFGLLGIGLVVKRLLRGGLEGRRYLIAAVLALPVLVHGYNLLFDLDVFPRHTLPFLPFLALLAGYGLIWTFDHIRGSTVRLSLVLAAGLWMMAFVFDAERDFITEPRNKAYMWLERNVAEATPIWWYYHHLDRYPEERFPESRPPVLVVEMIQANHILSGVGFRNSFPTDYRNVFDVTSQYEVDQLQALFRGSTEYREVARFGEECRMPEFLLEKRLLGDRSRSYITEVVIFRRDGG